MQGLRRGVDIVVACPGRLEDLIQQGHCDLGAVEITVLDEADHMADLGFLPAVRRLLARPRSTASGCSSPPPWTGASTYWSSGSSSSRSPTGRLGAVADRDDGPPRPARGARAPRAGAGRPDQRPGADGRLHPDQARREGADPAAQPQWRARRRAARQPEPGRPHPQHGGVPRRPGDARWSPPTSPRAASTSTTSPW